MIKTIIQQVSVPIENSANRIFFCPCTSPLFQIEVMCGANAATKSEKDARMSESERNAYVYTLMSVDYLERAAEIIDFVSLHSGFIGKNPRFKLYTSILDTLFCFLSILLLLLFYSVLCYM